LPKASDNYFNRYGKLMKTLILIIFSVVFISCSNPGVEQSQSINEEYSKYSKLGEDLFLYEKDFEKAIIYLNKAIEMHPDSITGLNAHDFIFRGGARMELGKFKDAIKDFSKSQEILSIPYTLVKIGDCWLGLNDTSKACQFFLEAKAKGFNQNDSTWTPPHFCENFP
jgi:tetratricopeptide (TPR) repeat protein